MFSITSTVSPLAAAELVAVRVTLGGTGVVRQRELWSAPPVPPPQSHPVLHLVSGGPVVHAAGTLAVVSSRPAVAPVGAAVILNKHSIDCELYLDATDPTRAITFTWFSIIQRKLWSTSPVRPDSPADGH